MLIIYKLLTSITSDKPGRHLPAFNKYNNFDFLPRWKISNSPYVSECQSVMFIVSTERIWRNREADNPRHQSRLNIGDN